MKAAAVIIGTKYKRYRLNGRFMEQLNSLNNQVSSYGHYTTLPNIRWALIQLKDGASDVKLRTYRTRYFADYTAQIVNGAVKFGCTRFNKADTRKLAKWAGLSSWNGRQIR